MKSFVPGSSVYGFKVISRDDLDEYRSEGIHLVHEKTGAQVYHVLNQDPENLFSFCFKTPPSDSTGVAHILEHSVLCGSQNFPIKDPFVYLLKSSLKTFLNAWTFPDKTVYPASSVVEKDYFNLMQVYGDAVFFPLLKPEVFAQEGHHLEWDEKGQLIVSGVVYNEMKGNFSSPDGVIGEWTQRSLFADGPYSYNSGGDPAEIPNLTYENFLKFHKTYYHPSNCIVFLYGNIPTEKQLKALDEWFFRRFKRGQSAPEIGRAVRWSDPRFQRKPIPAAEDQQPKSTHQLCWLSSDSLDFEKSLAMDILSELLLGDAGLLHKALVDSGLGEDLSPVSGAETEIREVIFSVGLRGCEEKAWPEFEKLVFSELRRYIEQGIPHDLLEGVLASYEFSVREVKGGGMGIRLLRRALKGWLHGADPADSLAFGTLMRTIRFKLKSGKYFEDLIRSELLENPHRVGTIFYPDPELQRREEQTLARQMEEKASHMSEVEKLAVTKSAEVLKAFQSADEKPSDVEKLPILHRSDIPVRVEVIEAAWDTDLGVPLSVHEEFTNGVAYVDLAFDLGALSAGDYPLLGIFQRALDSLGLPGLEYDLLAREIQLKTGGLSFRATVDTALTDGKIREKLWVRVKMLESRIDDALDLVRRILTQTAWENVTRLKDIVFEAKNDWVSALVPNGHLFAMYRASAPLCTAAYLNELVGGLSQLDVLKRWTPADEKIALEVVAKLSANLAQLSRKIFLRNTLMANITGESPYLGRLKTALAALVDALPERAWNEIPKSSAALGDEPHQIFQIPSTVGFSSVAIPASSLDETGHAAELVLSHHLDTGYLWENIRMKGGAYGAFSQANGLESTFVLASYRDPQLLSTLKTFKDALSVARTQVLSKPDLDLTLLGTVASELRPRSPSENGYLFLLRHILGVTDEVRQKKRDALLRLTPKDVVHAAERLSSRLDRSRAVTLSGASIIQKAQETDPKLAVRPINL